MLFVGLFDSNGNIQINKYKSKYLQFRLIIKLNNNKENINILNNIKHYLKGNININNNYVIWIINDIKNINNLIKLFNKYPLITINKKLQLAFIKSIYYIYKNNRNLAINLYLKDRNNKYNPNLYKYYKDINYTKINYFSPANFHKKFAGININININNNYNHNYINVWFLGFIENKGKFIIRKNNNNSFLFYINDKHLIEFLKNYFNIKNKLIYKNNIYILEVYNKYYINIFIKFFNKYNLQGYKYIEYIKWKKINI